MAPTVLLVEDDPDIAEMYRLGLESGGFRVLMAADGPAAIAAARAAPDIVFLDVRLPGASGFEVLRELKSGASTCHLPVVMLSNYSDPQMIARSFLLGAADYRVKGYVSPQQLTRIVPEILGAAGADAVSA